jgi:endonuclease I
MHETSIFGMTRGSAGLRIGLALVALLGATACGRSPLGLAAVNGAANLDAAKAGTSPTTVDAYYRSAANLSGPNLARQLQRIVKAGPRVFSYGDARDHMFAAIDDATNQNVVVDVYCGRTAKGVTDRNSAFQRGLNAEHTWPQSLGAKEEPAKSDLHHLFPADAGTNSTRNNHAYGVPGRVTETLPNYLDDGMNSKIGELADGTIVFEPRDDHKGDVARALFYFYVRYGIGHKAGDGVDVLNFRKEFGTLWRWHFVDPPSAKEKARNEAIYRLQRNRNPFIDHPEYVQRIGHFLGARMPGEVDSDIVAGHNSREDLPAPAFGF